MGMHIHEGERRLKDPGEKLFADPAQGETGQGDAELGRRQVGVEMSADVLGENGTDVAFVFKRIELESYQLDFVTPGMNPPEASSRKVRREILNRRMNARRRPLTSQRLTTRVGLASRGSCDRAI